MPNPKRRHTRTRTATRRAHDAITPTKPSACPQCQQPKLSHRVCAHCGYYRGVEVIAPREE
jgi:large subunit ribosomal protein L32